MLQVHRLGGANTADLQLSLATQVSPPLFITPSEAKLILYRSDQKLWDCPLVKYNPFLHILLCGSITSRLMQPYVFQEKNKTMLFW